MDKVGRRTLMYIILSTLTPLSSGNCCRAFSRNELIVSPFLHYAGLLAFDIIL